MQQRVVQLSLRSQEVLAVAAVAGRRFDFAMLHALLPLDEQALLKVLQRVRRGAAGRRGVARSVAFRHALTREAIYSRLLTRERQALHRRVAEAIERLVAGTPDTRLADLSYHSFEARLWDKALMYARRAGEQAAAMYAPHAAVEHFGRALDAAAHLGMPAPMELHRARGRANESIGEFAAARADYEGRSRWHVPVQGSARGVAGVDRPRLLVGVARLWAHRRLLRAGARSRACSGRPGARLRRASIASATGTSNVQQPLEALSFHMEAQALFEQLGDRRGMAETARPLGDGQPPEWRLPAARCATMSVPS